jgi:hypothetical protein
MPAMTTIRLPTTDGGAHSLTVRPASGRADTWGLLCCGLAVGALLAGFIAWLPSRPGPPQLLSWQLSSFDGLGAVDQAIHSALLPAAEEITIANNDTGGWITMEQAQASLLPPFYRDAFWKKNGEVQWQLILPGMHEAHVVSHDEADGHAAHHTPQPTPNAVSEGTLGQGATVYYGTNGHAPGQSAYLLVIGHAHAGVMWTNQATIWVHPDPHAPYPGVVKPEGLVGKGWRQVVPYTGASEVERVKGPSHGQ